jgi:hypothetical protein
MQKHYIVITLSVSTENLPTAHRQVEFMKDLIDRSEVASDPNFDWDVKIDNVQETSSGQEKSTTTN